MFAHMRRLGSSDTPFCACVQAMLLQYGADPNARKTRGETPLHVAVGTADVEKVRILTNYRADPLIKGMSCFLVFFFVRVSPCY